MIQEIADALVQSWRTSPPRSSCSCRDSSPPPSSSPADLPSRSSSAAPSSGCSRGCASIACRCAPVPARCCAWPTCRPLKCSIAKIVFWIVWIGSSCRPSTRCSSAPFQGLVEEFFRFVPRFLVALLVLSLGFLVGNFLWRATLLASVNAGLPGARLLSGALRVLVIAIGVVMAFEQLGLATAVVLTAFAITFGALMLGLAIAFGLGGRDAAKPLHRASSSGPRTGHARS